MVTKLNGIASNATANTGTITGVTAGNGLTGGGSSGSVTLNVGAGNGITVEADTVSAKAGTGTGISVDTNGIHNAGVRSITQDKTDGHKLIIDTGGSTSSITIPDNNTTYSVATTSADGLMSKAMVTKLNGIPSNATANTGTITAVKANGTSVATSGEADIPAATTSAYGVTKLSSSTSDSSTTTAATPSAVKEAYELANGKAPMYDYSSTDITAGSTSLSTGKMYLVYV